MKSLMLPRLYALLDADVLRARSVDLTLFTSDLIAAGVTLFQYRNKTASDRIVLNDVLQLRNAFDAVDRAGEAPKALGGGNSLKLILNDRADLALLSACQGVHVGQDDLLAEDARRIVGPNRWVGVSTHTPEQIVEADQSDCDYIAYGPIFRTHSKQKPDPLVGLDGLRRARSLTRKPLVAIGGITRQNCRSVLDAGADSLAVISDLAPTGGSAQPIAEEFLALLV